MPETPELVIILSVIALLVVSLGIHEAAHGWVALQCGDTTARDLGRITLNPIAHIDPVMTLILPAVLFYTTGFIFGGAKPVPVAFHRLRHPWRDMSLVALAGPASNFLLACLFFLLWKLAILAGYGSNQVLPQVFQYSILFNLLLTAFNLIPIPPLDGSRVMAWLLPEGLRPAYLRLESIGLLLIFGLIWLGPLRPLILSVMDGMFDWVEFLVTAGGLW